MNQNHPALSLYVNQPSRLQNASDPLDEFISQIMYDFDVPYVVSNPTHPSTSSGYEQAQAPVHSQAPLPLLNCRWVPHGNAFFCGAPIPLDSKHACEHFRTVHNVRGNEKVTVNCLWHGCHAPPMQRGSLIRHVLAVHLRLLQWQCERCGRVFSRKGTGHLCPGARRT